MRRPTKVRSTVLALLVSAGLVTFGPAPLAHAGASYTWTGVNSGDWTDPGNWDPNGVPGESPDDSAIIGPTPGNDFPTVSGIPDGTTLKSLAVGEAQISGGGIELSQSLAWSSGTIWDNLALDPGATGSISGSNANSNPTTILYASTLTNAGDLSISGTFDLFYDTTKLINEGALHIDGRSDVQGSPCCLSGHTPELSGSGTIDIGSLLGGDVTIEGLWFAPTGVVNLGSNMKLQGPATLATGLSFTGSGTVEDSLSSGGASGPATASGSVQLGPGVTFKIEPYASLAGTGTIDGGGKIAWVGGDITGKLTLAQDIKFAVSGAAQKTLAGPATLTVAGRASMANTEIGFSYAPHFISTGDFAAGPGSKFSGACCPSTNPNVFDNRGQFTVSSGDVTFTGVAVHNSGTANLKGGSLDLPQYAYSYVQTDGKTLLDGGAINASSHAVEIQKGSLSGAGTITGSLVNSGGTIDIHAGSSSVGRLEVSRDFKQTAGTLAVDVGGTKPGDGFDQLTAGARARLGGTLHLQVVNGFKPKARDRFAIVTSGVAGGRTDKFATVSGDRSLQVGYLTRSVVLLTEPPVDVTTHSPAGSAGDATHNRSETEPAVAVDPTNRQDVVTVANPDTSIPTGLIEARSSDGGSTWVSRLVADRTPTPIAFAFSDPTLSWDRFGNLFLAYVTAQPAAARRVAVVLSTNGGATWAPLVTLGSGVDQPTVTTGHGMVWITYEQGGSIRATGAPVTGRGPSGVGAFLAHPERVSVAGQSLNFGDIAIGPDGQVLVAFQTVPGSSGPSDVYVARDADGLGSGHTLKLVNGGSPVVHDHVGDKLPLRAQPNNPVDVEAGLGFALNGAHRGRAYLVYTDSPAVGSKNTDVRVIHSDNDFATHSAPTTVNSDTTRSQFLPRIAVDEATGTIAVSWYDCRADDGKDLVGSTNQTRNDDAEYWVAFSNNGGGSFADREVSVGPSNASASHQSNDYGDYSGLAFDHGAAYPAWADNSDGVGGNPNGTLHGLDIYVARVSP